MRYREFIVDGSSINSQSEVEKILKSNGFYWLIDSEIENASIELKNNTIIWKDGKYYSGNWHYGIFKSGIFSGKWENGIFEGGIFNGEWKSGINKLI